MAHYLLSVTVVAVFIGATFAIADTPEDNQTGVALSPVSKKSRSARQPREAGQIACTVTGCHRIPPGCRPEMGYNWDGIPTGFDVVVCRYPHGRQS
ncbi:MAG TPA: hypothetical protein VH558_05495 [Pseudolabrys sp.]|jgi:hypothetical protein